MVDFKLEKRGTLTNAFQREKITQQLYVNIFYRELEEESDDFLFATDSLLIQRVHQAKACYLSLGNTAKTRIQVFPETEGKINV